MGQALLKRYHRVISLFMFRGNKVLQNSVQACYLFWQWSSYRTSSTTVREPRWWSGTGCLMDMWCSCKGSCDVQMAKEWSGNFEEVMFSNCRWRTKDSGLKETEPCSRKWEPLVRLCTTNFNGKGFLFQVACIGTILDSSNKGTFPPLYSSKYGKFEENRKYSKLVLYFNQAK